MPRIDFRGADRAIILWLALGLWLAVTLGSAFAFFPSSYHWERDVISSLASPRDNPHAYLIGSLGLAGAGALLLLVVPRLGERLRGSATRLATWAGAFFRAGALTLLLSAVIVPGHYRILGLARLHEHFAQLSGGAFCVSMVLYAYAVLHLPTRYSCIRRTFAIVVGAPLAGFLADRTIFFSTEIFSPRATYRAVKDSAWSNLALWEWLGFLSIYLAVGMLLALVPAASSQQSSR